MSTIMTWEEMKQAFPNEWLRVVHYELDAVGQLARGEVLYHASSKEEVYSQPLSGQSEAFWFTGESTFSGLRSHATHHSV